MLGCGVDALVVRPGRLWGCRRATRCLVAVKGASGGNSRRASERGSSAEIPADSDGSSGSSCGAVVARERSSSAVLERVAACVVALRSSGLTETCGLSSLGCPDEMALVGTVGYPSTYTEMRLEEVPEMGYDPLAVPSRGEICVRGKTVFSGYHKDPELTKEVMRDGWFHTGDIGEMNVDGVLKIIDRKKNIFKLSQGEYVAVEYLEKLYGFPPIIEDVWVYGDSFRSMLVAVVIPHEDNTKTWGKLNGHKGSFTELCSLDELKTYILFEMKAVAEKNKLRGFEHIRGMVVDPQPFDIERDLVTPTMKKKRGHMLKHYQAEIDRLYKSLTEGRQ